MDENKTNAGLGLGIAGLVLGIIAILICFIPCIGIIALIPGVVGITLSAIALNQANKANGAKGLIIAALVVSILGTTIAMFQGLVFSSGEKFGRNIWHKIDKNRDDEAGKYIEDKLDDVGSEMEKVLDDLENVGDSIHLDIKIGKKLSDEEFKKLITDYESLLKETQKLADESKKGGSDSEIRFNKLALKVAALHAKLLANTPNLTADQRKKLEELNTKYDKTLQDIKE